MNIQRTTLFVLLSLGSAACGAPATPQPGPVVILEDPEDMAQGDTTPDIDTPDLLEDMSPPDMTEPPEPRTLQTTDLWGPEDVRNLVHDPNFTLMHPDLATERWRAFLSSRTQARLIQSVRKVLADAPGGPFTATLWTPYEDQSEPSARFVQGQLFLPTSNNTVSVWVGRVTETLQGDDLDWPKLDIVGLSPTEMATDVYTQLEFSGETVTTDELTWRRYGGVSPSITGQALLEVLDVSTLDLYLNAPRVHTMEAAPSSLTRVLGTRKRTVSTWSRPRLSQRQ